MDRELIDNCIAVNVSLWIGSNILTNQIYSVPTVMTSVYKSFNKLKPDWLDLSPKYKIAMFVGKRKKNPCDEENG